MNVTFNMDRLPKSVAEFLGSHKEQITREDYTGWFKTKTQLEFNTAEYACQVLRAIDISPFNGATEGEVSYACSFMWLNGHSLGDNLNTKVLYRPSLRADHLAPVLAALGANVYEYQDSETGEVMWVVLPPHRELKETLKYLLQDRVVTNSSLSDYVKIDQNARY